MAKKAAHGTEIGKVEYLRYSKCFMSDGTILKNSGFGWKIYGTVKVGVSIQTAFANAKAHEMEFNQNHPAFAAYKKAVFATCGLSKRWKLLTAIETMPTDPDGVWSEVCDGYGDNINADLDEIAELCRLYLARMDEQIHKTEA